MRDRRRTSERGQTAVLVALLMVGLLAATGLAIDGGLTMKLRRDAQNASDAAALAGARQVASYRDGNEVTDQDVVQAVNDLAERNGVPDTDGNPGNEINENVTARYVDEDNNVLPHRVGDGTLPEQATGVRVEVKIEGAPSFIQVASNAKPRGSAVALAQTGLYEGGVPGEEPEDEDEGVDRALSHVTFTPQCGGGECTVTDPPEGEYEDYPITRSTSAGNVTVMYNYENWGDKIKFEDADGGYEGLGEDGACPETDTFVITVEPPAMGTTDGFTITTFTAGYSDWVWRSVTDLESEPVQLENHGFWIELYEHTGKVFTFKIHSCLSAINLDPDPDPDPDLVN